MPFVVDASVVGSWVLRDENHPEALTALERLKDDEAFAPSALSLVQELPLRLDGQADSDTTLQLARAHRLTIYDAAYLELAVRRHLPLVTFDTALAEAARSEKR
jgi:predicted nucleic acid-binding protein